MPIKINEFIIQAKISEEDEGVEAPDESSPTSDLSESVKQEIIDECVAKMKELLAREKTRF